MMLNDDLKADRVVTGSKSVVMRLSARLKANAISPQYAREAMGVLFDIGVTFPKMDTALEYKKALLKQFEEFSFTANSKTVEKLRPETNRFIYEIAPDNPAVKELLIAKRQAAARLENALLKEGIDSHNHSDNDGEAEVGKNIILNNDIKWTLLTTINKQCSEFSDMFLSLRDDIPKRRADGWMNDIYLDFLEEGVASASTLWQIEKIRENFEEIKVVHVDAHKYSLDMKGIVNNTFLKSIEEEIGKATSLEKVEYIVKNFGKMKIAIVNILKYGQFSRDLKTVETFEDIYAVMKKVDKAAAAKKRVMEEKAHHDKSAGLMKGLFTRKK